jgi:ABC-2 type transport system ATP-binding protein
MFAQTVACRIARLRRVPIKPHDAFGGMHARMAETMIHFDDLTIRYGECVAVAKLSFDVYRGELFGLLGPNGAGKSSTLRVLIGQRRPSAGRVWVAGYDVVRDWAAVKPLFGYVPDRENHFDEFTGRRNLTFFAQLYRAPLSHVDECLELMELTDAADVPVRAYSMGMRRKLLLARALLHEPALLYLDEPTANLDGHSIALVRRTLKNLTAAGCTVILTTHNMTGVEEMCDRVAILCEGALIALDSPLNLQQDNRERKVNVVLQDGVEDEFNLDITLERKRLAQLVAEAKVDSVHKEVLRQLANRGGMLLALLLVVVTLLMSVTGEHGSPFEALHGGVAYCFVDYWQEDPWLDHLRANVPTELRKRVHFRSIREALVEGQEIVYPAATGAIQLRSTGELGKDRRYKVWSWQPHHGSGFSAFEAWFWKESTRYFQERTLQAEGAMASGAPVYDQESSELTGGLDTQSALATSLVLFALFFACVYLLPSLMCEERERGVLLAQALSPASPAEILAAKCLFYPLLGIGLAAILVFMINFEALFQPFFWLALLVTAVGSLGIGLTIASLARTQRNASMTALGYMLAIALLLYVCQNYRVPFVQYFSLEFHGPRMLHAVLSGTFQVWHWANLGAALLITISWMTLATFLFRRQGWQ